MIKVNWIEKRLKSCEKMSKICQIILSAEVFYRCENVGRQRDFANFWHFHQKNWVFFQSNWLYVGLKTQLVWKKTEFRWENVKNLWNLDVGRCFHKETKPHETFHCAPFVHNWNFLRVGLPWQDWKSNGIWNQAKNSYDGLNDCLQNEWDLIELLKLFWSCSITFYLRFYQVRQTFWAFKAFYTFYCRQIHVL